MPKRPWIIGLFCLLGALLAIPVISGVMRSPQDRLHETELQLASRANVDGDTIAYVQHLRNAIAANPKDYSTKFALALKIRDTEPREAEMLFQEVANKGRREESNLAKAILQKKFSHSSPSTPK
jgi:hypothetical protein